jgi:hypothetical protein
VVCSEGVVHLVCLGGPCGWVHYCRIPVRWLVSSFCLGFGSVPLVEDCCVQCCSISSGARPMCVSYSSLLLLCCLVCVLSAWAGLSSMMRVISGISVRNLPTRNHCGQTGCSFYFGPDMSGLESVILGCNSLLYLINSRTPVFFFKKTMCQSTDLPQRKGK